jgi:type IV secretory pathway TrbD component
VSAPLIPGYEAPIHRALWERILTMGAPRMWAGLWSAVCLGLGMVFLFTLGMRWLLLPVGLWLSVQGGLVLLTQWDQSWDDIALAHLTRRYKQHYEAG